ncbi:MAG: hypothetical protein KC646_17880 [Candidatus Cloacimonetes bacterium]|nr:hypothetical protein [Candidatus Cloacimonadota bacterium]
MIELLQTKAKADSVRIMQNFLLHVVFGLFILNFQAGLFGSGLIFALISLWICFPFFNELKLGLSLYILSMVFCFVINIVHPIWLLFIFFTFQFIVSKGGAKLLLTRTISLVLVSVFLQNTFSTELLYKNYLLLSSLVAIFCYLDFFLIACAKTTLKLLERFQIYNFIDENLSLENDYRLAINNLEFLSLSESYLEETDFLLKSYGLNFKLFLLSLVKLWTKNTVFLEKFKLSFEEIRQVRNQLQNILDKIVLINRQESLLSLDEVNHLFVELHQFYEDYESEVKTLM